MKFIPDHWKKHIKDITGGKMTAIFQGLAKKNRQRKQLYDMNGQKPFYWISEIYDLANFQSPPPYNQVFTETLLICETALFLWYQIFPKRPIRQPDVFYRPDSG